MGVNCVVYESKSVVTGQKRLRAKFGRDPPKKSSFYAWYNLFDKRGCFCTAKDSVETSLIEATMKEVDTSSGE
jgi:hypothetical protein